MVKQIVIAAVLIASVLLLERCKGSNGHGSETHGRIPNQEELIQVNKSSVQAENARIKAFIQRKKWVMQETGTGLRYMSLEFGDSTLAFAQVEQQALVDVEVRLLTGELVYTTKDTGPQWFKVGMSDVESGLHEGIQLMRPGDKTRFILPSHLAHGLLGDLNGIPPGSPIIYDVKLHKLS